MPAVLGACAGPCLQAGVRKWDSEDAEWAPEWASDILYDDDCFRFLRDEDRNEETAYKLLHPSCNDFGRFILSSTSTSISPDNTSSRQHPSGSPHQDESRMCTIALALSTFRRNYHALACAIRGRRVALGVEWAMASIGIRMMAAFRSRSIRVAIATADRLFADHARCVLAEDELDATR